MPLVRYKIFPLSQEIAQHFFLPNPSHHSGSNHWSDFYYYINFPVFKTS